MPFTHIHSFFDIMSSSWSIISQSHKDTQRSLEKTCECLNFITSLFDQYYRIEEQHMQNLTKMVESSEQLLSRNEAFNDLGTSGFYKEITENLLSHARGKISQFDQLLSTLDIDVKLRLADTLKELQTETDEHRKYIQTTNEQIAENDRERVEAEQDLEHAKAKLEKGYHA